MRLAMSEYVQGDDLHGAAQFDEAKGGCMFTGSSAECIEDAFDDDIPFFIDDDVIAIDRSRGPCRQAGKAGQADEGWVGGPCC